MTMYPQPGHALTSSSVPPRRPAARKHRAARRRPGTAGSASKPHTPTHSDDYGVAGTVFVRRTFVCALNFWAGFRPAYALLVQRHAQLVQLHARLVQRHRSPARRGGATLFFRYVY